MLGDVVGEEDTYLANRPFTRGDEALIVRFFLHPVRVLWERDEKGKPKVDEYQQRIKLAGRPIYEDRVYVSIRQAGDRFQENFRPATEADKRRFRTQYEAFEQGRSSQMIGTPLREWPLVPRSQVEELAFFNIHTVEQLAAVSDGNITQVGPISALKARAIDWLERAKDSARDDQLRAEIEKRDQLLSSQQAQLDAMREQMAAMSAKIDAGEAPAAASGGGKGRR